MLINRLGLLITLHATNFSFTVDVDERPPSPKTVKYIHHKIKVIIKIII